MEVMTGKVLKKRLSASASVRMQKRDCFGDVMRYLGSNDNPRILCLYGLWRTGKTVLMEQAMRETGDFDRTLYVIGERGDDFFDLNDALRSHPECRYIFINEATSIEGFVSASSRLANVYSSGGYRVVVAGTDSLGFSLAGRDELYDRIMMLHTSYVSFAEYGRLLGKGIEDYITYGGTLTDGNVFYNRDGNYTNAAIVSNITHSLKEWNLGREHDRLQSMVRHHDLASAISRILENSSAGFVADTVNREFMSHDHESLRNLLAREGDIRLDDIDSLHDRIRIFLGIKEYNYDHAEQEAIDQLAGYLRELDVLWRMPDGREIFVQPGLRYGQCEMVLDAMRTSDELREYSRPVMNAILRKLDEDVRGRILEDIVSLQTARTFSGRNYDIETVRNNATGQEADLVVSDSRNMRCAAFEVKHSSSAVPEQWKHLSSEDFCRYIESNTGVPVMAKAVIYTGRSRTTKDGEYINVEEYLKDPERMLERLFGWRQNGKEKGKKLPFLE